MCLGLPITTTIAGIWLNSLIFHNDNECIKKLMDRQYSMLAPIQYVM